MTLEDDRIYKLHQDEHAAYNYYVKVMRGDLLGKTQAPNPEEVAEARDAWAVRHEVLLDAGGTVDVIRRILIERGNVANKVHRLKS